MKVYQVRVVCTWDLQGSEFDAAELVLAESELVASLACAQAVVAEAWDENQLEGELRAEWELVGSRDCPAWELEQDGFLARITQHDLSDTFPSE